MTEGQKAAVKRLEELANSTDPERAHAEADDIILEFVPLEVAEAYGRLIDQSDWWAMA